MLLFFNKKKGMSAANEAGKLIQFQDTPTKTTRQCPLENGGGATFHMFFWALVNRDLQTAVRGRLRVQVFRTAHAL